jgi:hypothetical protein
MGKSRKENDYGIITSHELNFKKFHTDVACKSKAVPLHAMEALEGRGGITPTHS